MSALGQKQKCAVTRSCLLWAKSGREQLQYGVSKGAFVFVGRHMSPLCTPKKAQHQRRGLRQCHLYEWRRTTALNPHSHEAA
jgi:hypothetical protein